MFLRLSFFAAAAGEPKRLLFHHIIHRTQRCMAYLQANGRILQFPPFFDLFSFKPNRIRRILAVKNLLRTIAGRSIIVWKGMKSI